MDWISGLTLGGLAILAIVTVVSLDGIKNLMAELKDQVIKARDLRIAGVHYEVEEDHCWGLRIEKPCTYERLVEMLKERDERIKGLSDLVKGQDALESEKAELKLKANEIESRTQELNYYKLRHDTLVADKENLTRDRDAWKAKVTDLESQAKARSSGVFKRIPVETTHGIQFINVEVPESEVKLMEEVKKLTQDLDDWKKQALEFESKYSKVSNEFQRWKDGGVRHVPQTNGTMTLEDKVRMQSRRIAEANNKIAGLEVAHAELLRERTELLEKVEKLKIHPTDLKDRVIDELKEGNSRKSETIRHLESAGESYRAAIETLEKALEASNWKLRRFAAVCRIVKLHLGIDMLAEGALRTLTESLMAQAAYDPRARDLEKQLTDSQIRLSTALRDKEAAEKSLREKEMTLANVRGELKALRDRV